MSPLDMNIPYLHILADLRAVGTPVHVAHMSFKGGFRVSHVGTQQTGIGHGGGGHF
jgi:hypothetical protein